MDGFHITLSAVTAEVAERRKSWIGGVPTPADVDAMVRHLAHRLKTSEAIVRDMIGPINTVA